MSYFCPVILTRGKNVGKICGAVCPQCRHINKSCRGCGEQFNRNPSYQQHIKVCPMYACSLKIKPTVIKKLQVDTSEICNKVQSMEQSMLSMKTMLEQALERKPITTNIVNATTNVVYQTISISDIGAFKTLCDKMGTTEATDFLCKLAAKPQIMALFEKVYLECDPANYPIANNNGKDFFYRDADDKIVHDEGGHKITQLGERLMKNTFVEAADPLLTRFVKQNEGDHEGDDGDYDRFLELQNGACRTKADKSFIKELYPKTYNPNHAFFTENIEAKQ